MTKAERIAGGKSSRIASGALARPPRGAGRSRFRNRVWLDIDRTVRRPGPAVSHPHDKGVIFGGTDTVARPLGRGIIFRGGDTLRQHDRWDWRNNPDNLVGKGGKVAHPHDKGIIVEGGDTFAETLPDDLAAGSR
jgi:hypothetical protein